MKKRIIIVHGWGGSPSGDWIGWAAEEFKKRGYDVLVPEMPDTDTPIIEAWVKHLQSVAGAVDEQTYFIGHSIGCQAILRFLEAADARAGGALFVAGWFTLQNLEGVEEEEIARPWIETPIDNAKVKANLARSVAILSDNDPFVPYAETKEHFETLLGSKVVTAFGAGHFTAADGYAPFPQLVELSVKSFV